jgi:tetratricopeptide (TPR) repeat protein
MDVDGDKTFYTLTMARVYADQGQYEEAARIYRYLLDQTPDRKDLREALDAVTAMLPETSEPLQDLAGLVETVGAADFSDKMNCGAFGRFVSNRPAGTIEWLCGENCLAKEWKWAHCEGRNINMLGYPLPSACWC